MVISEIQGSEGKYRVSGYVKGDDITGIKFSDLVIDGNVTFKGFRVERVDLTDVPYIIKFKDCSINDLTIRSKIFHPQITINGCRVNGLKIKAEFEEFKIKDCRLEGKTELSKSRFSQLIIRGTNCEYVKATEIKAKNIDMTLSRFVQLFDLLGSTFQSIDMTDTIVLETFRLPDISDDEDMFTLILNNMTMNGKIILNVPGSYGLQKKFVKKTAENNNSSGMAALRSVFESNRRFEAADLAFMEQKKKERDKTDSEYETNKVQRAVSRFSYVFSGNGMRPSWTLGWMVMAILLFAVIYLMTDVRSGYDVGGMALIDAVYVSIVSFFVCDTFAVNTAGIWLMVVENIVGLLMMLCFTVILTRKMIR